MNRTITRDIETAAEIFDLYLASAAIDSGNDEKFDAARVASGSMVRALHQSEPEARVTIPRNMTTATDLSEAAHALYHAIANALAAADPKARCKDGSRYYAVLGDAFDCAQHLAGILGAMAWQGEPEGAK